MEKVIGIEYIESIGIKETICTTRMGNKIHILNNGKKYKEFSEDYQDLNDPLNIEFKDTLINQTKEYNHKLVSFPEAVVINKNILKGIITNYEIGEKLIDIVKHLTIEELILIIKELEEGILDISKKGWILEDLHEENILINLDKITGMTKIIDTDYYSLEKISSMKEALENYRKNLKNILFTIIYTIIPNLRNLSFYNKEFELYYILASQGEIKPSEFLLMLIKKAKLNNSKEEYVSTLQKRLH